jgi:hypothetical protein
MQGIASGQKKGERMMPDTLLKAIAEHLIKNCRTCGGTGACRINIDTLERTVCKSCTDLRLALFHDQTHD